MLTLILLLSVSRVIIIPADAIELNHVHTEYGQYQYSQVIIWEWSPNRLKNIPRAWRLVKDGKDTPARNGEFWIARVRDNTYKSKTFQETFTNYDREQRARL
jgi:hypothetical protein